jgi:carbonic anhydrase/acetyltransferase-like protein (isoleucine patch superfamily)
VTIDERLNKFLGRQPKTSLAAFVASNATLVGDVRLGRNSSVFYGAVLRGDIESIQIGEGTNVQDGAVIHLADDLPAVLGANCTIGHSAIIHACRIGDLCLVGMGAVVLDGAEIGDECLIGARALVTQRTKIPPRSLVIGSPAKVVRELTPEELVSLRQSAEKYIAVAQAHAARQSATAGDL